MFGYVNAHKDLLRVCDYNVFRGYYCGLCKMLGKEFHQLTRFGLSYDMTFLAILMSALDQNEIIMKYQPCIAHPVTKRPVILEDDGIRYSADMSVLLTYYKLKDDWDDEKSIKSFARLLYWFPMRKVAKKYPRQTKAIRDNLEKLFELEQQNCKNPDRVADCFGKLTEAIFDRNEDNLALKTVGYHIGRFIYFTDAYMDLEKDQKKKNYNPFLARSENNIQKEDLKNELVPSLTYTLNEIANAYELLTLYKNKELLDNIIYLGLRKTVESF
ncbi:MAG: hypothetical protein J6A61_00040 [Clostridia bacterium]|nr:hypothetical protein [Clostridia bacterium]